MPKSLTPEDISLQARNLRFDLRDALAKQWHGNDSFKTALFNALSITFPSGEKFFVESVRHFLPQIDDPKLKADATGFVQQEHVHRREHQRYNPGSALQADRLFPQLWAMARVEPVMETLLDDIYLEYLDKLEKRLIKMSSSAPRAEALALMSLLEGSTLFVGWDRRWANDATAVRNAALAFIDAGYGG